MRFWTWALEAYALPGAAEACLDLQDRFGQNIPFLLWAAWAASSGRALSAADLAAGADLARRWEAAAVGPLRAARRAMKAQVDGVPDAERETLRAEVKALELQAEQMLMERLEAAAPPGRAAPLPIQPALAAAARAWSPQTDPDALAGLARTLS
jgi:uncharacterized protein (TIGR02444 family)